MRTTFAWMLLLSVGATSAGCMIVSRDHLDSFGNADGGDGDAGPTGPSPDDVCGETNPGFLLVDTDPDIPVDTTGYVSDNASACGVDTIGNDAFIAVDVQAGEFWHFHLAAVTPGRQPMLYLTQSCDSRSCTYVSASCVGGQDEHFAFVADAPGRWFIAVDDSAEGGGEYRLAAYRPTCRDNTKDHGEGCDDGNSIDGDGCDRRCRTELSETATMEVEPNDNRVEANALRLPAANVLDITGNIGGPGACTYSDVYAINVPANGDVSVTALNADGTPCASSAVTPFFFALERSNGVVVQMGMQDANGCAVVTAADLVEGEYFIRVGLTNEITTPAGYRMRAALLP